MMILEAWKAYNQHYCDSLEFVKFSTWILERDYKNRVGGKQPDMARAFYDGYIMGKSEKNHEPIGNVQLSGLQRLSWELPKMEMFLCGKGY